MSSTAENPSAGRTASCPYTLASPGISPRKSRIGGPASFKSTPPLLIAQSRASRRFRRFLPLFTRTLVLPFESHALAVEREEPAVGDSDPVRVARQVGEHSVGSAKAAWHRPPLRQDK